MSNTEIYLAALAGLYTGELPEPEPLRQEMYLAKMAGAYDGELPEPVTREDMYLYDLAVTGGGGNSVSITDARGLFAKGYRLDAMQEILSICKDATNYTDMFRDAPVTELDLTGLDTSKVQSMAYMFNGCNKLKSLDLSGLDTSSVTDMTNMFPSGANCSIESITGFSALKPGIVIGLPTGTYTGLCPLKRLTFRTDLGANVHAVYSVMNISYCSFDRNGMVEMFNSLPDVAHRTVEVQFDAYKEMLNFVDGMINNGSFDTDSMVEVIDGNGFRYTSSALDTLYGLVYDESGGKWDVTTLPGPFVFIYYESIDVNPQFAQIAITGNPCVTDGTLTNADKAIATDKGWRLID